MRTGIQISSFKPLMTSESGLQEVLEFMKSIGCDCTQLQWIDKSIVPKTVARLLSEHGIKSIGVQDKSAFIIEAPEYYIDMCRESGGTELCFSGIPNADSQALKHQMDTICEIPSVQDITLSFHPVKADFGKALDELLDIMPNLKLVPDICQINDAGIDPIDFLNEHAGRISAVHFKDRDISGNICPVGAGKTDFKPILDTCEKIGVEYILVEQETWNNAFDELEQGFMYVKKLLTA